MTSPEATAALSAALKGATLAFNGQKTDTDKPKPKTKPVPVPKKPNLQHRDSGALLAATQASRDHGSISRPPSPTSPPARYYNGDGARGLGRQITGGSTHEYGQGAEHGAVTRKLTQYLGSSPGNAYLLSPGGRPAPDHRSASFIAATLAASRSVSPSPHHTGQGYFAHTPQLSHSPLHTALARRRSFGTSSIDSSTLDTDLPDTSSIPPTNSLISMFEKQKDDAAPVEDPVKKVDSSPLQPRTGMRPNLRARTPPQLTSPRGQMRPDEKHESERLDNPAVTPSYVTTPTPKPKPRPVSGRPRTPPPQIIRRAATEIVSPEPRRLGPKPNLQPPAVRPKATTESLRLVTKPPAKRPEQQPKPPTSLTSDEQHEIAQAGPDHLKPAPSTMSRPASASSTSSDDTFVSASSTRSPQPSSPIRGYGGPTASTEHLPLMPSPKRAPSPPRPNLRRASSMHNPSNPSAPARPRTVMRTSTTMDVSHPTSSSSSTLALDSLTSAIMAGSLAAERAPRSPAVPPPVPAPRRHHGLHLHPPPALGHHHATKQHHHTGGSSTSKSHSPQRVGGGGGAFPTTLRRAAEDDDSDGGGGAARHPHRRRRKPLQSKKKHAHHEGARKRWRDEVSARERKRYEAVWASNRGLFADRRRPVPPSSAADDDDDGGAGAEEGDLVPDVVVRDIWSRSRLPFDELAEVWDLVDRGRHRGGLDREEFVVGMWLIDQRLRGRKIPARVSDSVWDSARGMRVKSPKGKK